MRSRSTLASFFSGAVEIFPCLEREDELRLALSTSYLREVFVEEHARRAPYLHRSIQCTEAGDVMSGDASFKVRHSGFLIVLGVCHHLRVFPAVFICFR